MPVALVGHREPVRFARRLSIRARVRHLILVSVFLAVDAALGQGAYFFDASPLPATVRQGALRFEGPISVRADPCDRPGATLELDVWVFDGDYWPGVVDVRGYDILTVQLPPPTLTATGACVSTFSSSAFFPIGNVQTGTNYIVYFLRARPSGTCDGLPPDCYESFFRGGYYNGQEVLPHPPYRGPPAVPAYHAMTTAVEYHHADFEHYFLATAPTEIELLDAGHFPGWTRTGQSFGMRANGWSTVRGGMCRFFGDAFAPKSSHFFTTSTSECALVRENPVWVYETMAGYLTLPSVTGTCPLEGTPLYRLYNDGLGGAPNHRYTTSTTIRSEMIAMGWIPEGWGPAGVIGCAL